MVTFSRLGFLFTLVPTTIFLAWSLTEGLHSKTICAVLSLVSLKELLCWGWWIVSLWTPLSCFVVTMHLFSQSLSIILRCGVYCWMSSSATRVTVYSEDQAFPVQPFLSLCHRRHVAALCMLYKVNSISNHCVSSDLPSPSVIVWHSRAAAAAHPLEFDFSRCRTSQFASVSCRLILVRGIIPYTVFDTGTLDGFNGAVNRWLLP